MPDIFPENFEQKTGFDKIRIMLKSRCISTLGEDMTDNLRCLTEFDSVTILLGETEEFIRIIKEFQNFPATHFFDMRTALSRIRVEGRYLDENELFELKLSLESVKAIVDFFKKQDQQVFPLLKNKPELVAKAREVYRMLKKEIPQIMWDDNGNIGKRYRRQDEIGTPYCITVDFDTLGEKPELADTVTIRDRDTGEQQRIAVADIPPILRS